MYYIVIQKKMDTNITTIRLKKRQIATVNELGINLSEWVRNKIDMELISPQEIEVMLKKNEKEREKLLKIQKDVLQSNTTHGENSQEKQFLIETNEILKQNPTFLDGRINLFCNTFFKTKKPTKNQFLQLLENVISKKNDTNDTYISSGKNSKNE